MSPRGWAWATVGVVRGVALSLGWAVASVRRSASSASLYVRLRRGREVVDVRLSDHRPSKFATLRRSMFSIRESAPCRLAELPAYLLRRSAAGSSG